ncbi:50S ribosomal protein L4 [Thermodesulfomicrobium sp. WS]|jgi:large subunit ribosomal protein L4|uniref:50S ribosomal protein L4 n=1 Tax=Thermodesulfomicrobium sp. WS TaxID=3004129 RepID=UPI00249106D1|nr:50S ribosomal protein L4 [Thermodesulfomicrobium sp. WS]BDV00089.1 50S ribosomal protein L4 [Thermodesulfomicrobium sp. WS]
MAHTKVVNQRNEVVGEMDLADEIFRVEIRPEILHLAVRSHLAKLRAGTVGVKTRGLVRGGGKKPWRQKGTGRARAGSIRSPLWRGGAVVHGPVARDYGFKINKQVRRLALKMALSSKYATESLVVVDKLALERIKTKDFVACAKGLGLKKALIVVSEPDSNLTLSARNVPGMLVVEPSAINVYEILKYPQLVLDKGAVEALHARLK